jgi:hypothetical protein
MPPKRTASQVLSDRNRKFGYQLTNWLPLEETIRHLEPFFNNEAVIGIDYCVKQESNTTNYAIFTTGEFIGEDNCDR